MCVCTSTHTPPRLHVVTKNVNKGEWFASTLRGAIKNYLFVYVKQEQKPRWSDTKRCFAAKIMRFTCVCVCVKSTCVGDGILNI